MAQTPDNPPAADAVAAREVENAAGTTPAAETPPPAAEARPQSDRVGATLKLIPVIGGFLEYLYTHHGVVALVFAVLGFLGGCALVYSGKAPSFLCGTPPPPAPKVERQKVKPGTLSLGEPVEKPAWAEPYVKQFDLEGLSNDNEGSQIAGLGVDYFEIRNLVSKNEFDCAPFRLVARAGENDQTYMIDGHAFRLTTERSDGSNPQRLIQYLDSQADEPIKQSSIAFDVPGCKPEDRLAFVFRVQWKQGQKPPSNWMKSIQLETK
jgi:hypothetical protein